jgi:hypothetical protein
LHSAKLDHAERTRERGDRRKNDTICGSQVVKKIMGESVVGLGSKSGRVEMRLIDISPQ